MTLPLFDRPCPVCGTALDSVGYRDSTFDQTRWTNASFSSRKMPEYMHFRLLACTRCSVVYTSPAPSAGVTGDAYRSASFEAGTESAHAARTYASYLKKAGFQPGAALDIGAADGAFLRELLALGFRDVVGVEPSEAPVRSATADVRPFLREEQFDAGRFEPGTFDLVTCFQTIEHVYEPRELLTDVLRVLRPGGKTFLVAHNVEALSAKLLGEKSPIFDIEHMQLFNPRSLRLLLNDVGFRDVRVFPIWNAYPITYWAKLFPLPTSMKACILRALGRRPLRRIGDRLISVPAGNIAAFGTK